MVPQEFWWIFSSMSQSCRDCEVPRECLKERLYKIAEWEKSRKLEREINIRRIYYRYAWSHRQKKSPCSKKKCDLKIPTMALICSA